jgi:hypothetical protein
LHSGQTCETGVRLPDISWSTNPLSVETIDGCPWLSFNFIRSSGSSQSGHCFSEGIYIESDTHSHNGYDSSTSATYLK